MMMHKYLLIFLLSLVVLSNAQLKVSNTLGSNMVLQRAPQQARIWGWATAGNTVVVAFNNQNYNAQIDSTGAWSVQLPAMTAGGPFTIGVSASSGETLTLDNILFGDVYVCSGQSNMQFTVTSAFNATTQLARANKYPNVRLFSVGTHAISGTPLEELAQFDLGWSVASNTTVGGGDWTYMSAVCWFFGADLYDVLEIPIGLISTNWGGTYIQAWSSPDVLQQCQVSIPPFNASLGPNQPAALYNAMIVPFLPQAIAGALWYQGEANVGNAPLYACLEPAMIADWRSKFGTGYKFPFFFVQLAPWIDTSGTLNVYVAQLRDSQLAGMTVGGVGYASAVDLGDPTSPFGSIHPRNKETVGQRLLSAAQNIAYGDTSVVWQGPTFASATKTSANQVGTIVVAFTTYGKSGLVTVTPSCPTNEGVPANNCAGWEVQLNDNNWYPATSSSASGNVATVTINLPSATSTILGVRYAYSIWPLISLYSAEELPAIPFSYTFSS